MSLQVLSNKELVSYKASQASVELNDYTHYIVATPKKRQKAYELKLEEVTADTCSVPLNFWLEHREALKAAGKTIAVQIGADDSVEGIADQLDDMDIVVLPFESYVNGQSYTHAYLLRKRYNFKGEIRAVGDVHHDQLNFLARVGVDSFEVPNEESLQTAIKAFTMFSEVYQPSADDGQLIYSKRRAVH